MERLKAKDYDVVPDELTFEMEDQLGVFDIHPKTGFYNLAFYTIQLNLLHLIWVPFYTSFYFAIFLYFFYVLFMKNNSKKNSQIFK